MGQQPHPMDGRGWAFPSPSPKDVRDKLVIPPDWLGYRKERDWLGENRHLNDLVESTAMNVGGFGMDVKVSSPPMTSQSVGGVIVVGVRESRAQGEGGQGIDAVLV